MSLKLARIDEIVVILKPLALHRVGSMDKGKEIYFCEINNIQGKILYLPRCLDRRMTVSLF